MVRKRGVLILSIVMVMALCPSIASAESDVLAWLDGLSGPGPFTVKFKGVEANVLCYPLTSDCYFNDGVDVLGKGHGDARWLLKFGASWGNTGDNPLFRDDPNDSRNVSERALTIMVMYRANRVVDAGAGVQRINFRADAGTGGAAFDFWRTGLVPARLSVTPFGLLTASGRWRNAPRLIHLQVDTVWFKDGFSHTDFGNTTSKYSTGSEYQTRMAILFDAGALFWGATGR